MTKRTRIPLVVCALFLFGASLPRGGSGTETILVQLAYVGDSQNSALLGVRQGLNEANLQGRFLGQDYRLDIIDPAAATGMNFPKYLAVLAAVDKDQLLKLAELAGQRPVFNLAADDDALRAACRPNLLHVIPSAVMKRSAVAQWDKVHPGASVAATAWHADFVKFAGRDLNKRFVKAFSRPMDEYAWAGWAAVKMASDSVARGDATDAAALLDFLKSRLSFDGQKGVDMNFRETGQLRQTLMITDGGKLAGEAPVRGVAEPDDLDSLDRTGCSR